MPFEIVRNDIANMQVDAIVNTVSRKPSIGYACSLLLMMSLMQTRSGKSFDDELRAFEAEETKKTGKRKKEKK